MAKYCAGCGQELAAPEAFDEEYTYCRSYCCKCCPDSKKRTCQKERIDKARGKSFWDGW